MSNRLPIEPLYHVEAQSLKRNEARRIGRHALAPLDRAALWPVDSFEYEQQYKRTKTIQDIVFIGEMIVIGLCMLRVATG